MSTGLSRGGVAALVLGGFTLVSVFGYFAFKFYKSKAISAPVKKPIITEVEKDEEEDEEEDDEDEDHADESHSEEVRKDVKKDGKTDVETTEDIEDVDAYKAKYDDTIRLAKKLLSGNAYVRAAEKFKEAIKLAEHVPSASRDLITLYNNSSAMYEKAGVYDEALLDINIVLHMDNKHIKARLRRARIFDIQGKQLAALNDYVMVMLIEQSKGENSGAGQAAAVDKLAKTLAAKETSKYMNKMRENKILLGPATKGYSKQFFESFPSYYVWGCKFASLDRESLSANLLSPEEDHVVSIEDRLKFTLDLICFDIYHRRFAKAHELLISDKMIHIVLEAKEKLASDKPNDGLVASSSSSSSSSSSNGSVLNPDSLEKLLSVYHDLMGSYHQLSCRFGDAETEYDKALALWKDNIDARLKLIMLFIEYGETYTAESLYTDWLQQVVASQPPPLIPLDSLSSSSNTSTTVAAAVAGEEGVKDETDGTTGVVTDVIENILSSVTGTTTEVKPAAEVVTNGTKELSTSTDSTATTPTVTPVKATSNVTEEPPVKVSSPVKSWQTAVGVSTPLPAESAVLEAWIVTHRAGLWTCRDASGTYMPEAVNLAISDISNVRKITENYKNEANPALREALKGARYVAALKAQYVVSHTAGQMGVLVTPSQTEFVKVCTEISTELFPESDTVQLQEIEALLNEGELDKALLLVEKGSAEVKARGDTSLECTYLLMAANIVTQQAFGLLNDYSGNAAGFQSTMQEAVELYERAVAVEPTSSEAIAPYAQLKCFMGDFKNAVSMVEGALKLVRTRDETQDLYQLFFMTRAQAQVVDELK